MIFEFDQVSAFDRYHLLTQTITPRPVAWILTRNENKTYNLAPFSFFAVVSPDPALLMVSIGNKSGTIEKDTKRNLIREQECVLHIASLDQINAVNDSAATLDYGDSEIEKSGLSLADYTNTLPRIKEAKVAMHCRVYEIQNIGDSSFSACYLEIINLYVDDAIYKRDKDRNIVNFKQLNPISRLGGNDYGVAGETLTIKRPN